MALSSNANNNFKIYKKHNMANCDQKNMTDTCLL